MDKFISEFNAQMDVGSTYMEILVLKKRKSKEKQIVRQGFNEGIIHRNTLLKKMIPPDYFNEYMNEVKLTINKVNPLSLSTKSLILRKDWTVGHLVKVIRDKNMGLDDSDNQPDKKADKEAARAAIKKVTTPAAAVTGNYGGPDNPIEYRGNYYTVKEGSVYNKKNVKMSDVSVTHRAVMNLYNEHHTDS